jgi:hydroxyethylthiazole kinase-like uncharacterized protein yjeF
MSRRRVAPARLITAALLRQWPLPELPAGADKKARGDVVVVGGSRQVPGAVILSGVAALRAGAGRVRIGTARSAAVAVATAFPESAVFGLPENRRGELSRSSAGHLKSALAGCKALLVGPGMRAHEAVAPLLRQVLRAHDGCALVLDAAALRTLEGKGPFAHAALTGVVATPHAGEMAKLCGCKREEVEREPLELAREVAQRLGVCLVLKGTETFIADPDGRVFRNVAGNVGLATAGSGDCLAGFIAGLAARGAEPVQAAVWGVYLHARAGDVLQQTRGPLGYLARELSDEVPALLRSLGRPRQRR